MTLTEKKQQTYYTTKKRKNTFKVNEERRENDSVYTIAMATQRLNPVEKADIWGNTPTAVVTRPTTTLGGVGYFQSESGTSLKTSPESRNTASTSRGWTMKLKHRPI